jgi:succinate dehydrogenase/fumarate reductase flavoprotein subunit
LTSFFRHLGIFRSRASSVMIAGASNICYYLSTELLDMGMDVKIIDQNEQRCLQMAEKLPKALLITGDGADSELLREEGIDPIEVIDDVQNIMCPVENSIYMSQHRLDVCLRKLEKVKAKVDKMKANDLHGMLSCHEAEAMVLCCEMQMKAATMRKESRGWFLREDFPLMDNENWLKWIIVKNEDGEMKLHTEDVPIEKYPVQVPKF